MIKKSFLLFLAVAVGFTFLSYPGSTNALSVPGVGPFGGVVVSTTRCSLSCGSFWRGRVYNVLLTPQLVTVPVYVSRRAKLYDYKQRSAGTFVLGESKLDPRQFTCARRRGWKCRSVPAVSWVTDIGSSKNKPTLQDIANEALEFLEEFVNIVIDSFQTALEQLASQVQQDFGDILTEKLGDNPEEALEGIIEDKLKEVAGDVFSAASGDPTEILIQKVEELLPDALGNKLTEILGAEVADRIKDVIKSVFNLVREDVNSNTIALIDPIPALTELLAEIRASLKQPWL
jgi:hypothetical protein